MPTDRAPHNPTHRCAGLYRTLDQPIPCALREGHPPTVHVIAVSSGGRRRLFRWPATRRQPANMTPVAVP